MTKKVHAKIIIDVQNDFVFHKLLGSEAARAALPNIVKFIEDCGENDVIFYTKDTHHENYMDTLEGKHLPIPHCIKPTEGWQICPTVKAALAKKDKMFRVMGIEKNTFGSIDLMDQLKDDEHFFGEGYFEDITFVGFCTDICVISNALLARAYFPNTPIYVKADCCAGVTPESHQAALTILKANHIDII